MCTPPLHSHSHAAWNCIYNGIKMIALHIKLNIRNIFLQVGITYVFKTKHWMCRKYFVPCSAAKITSHLRSKNISILYISSFDIDGIVLRFCLISFQCHLFYNSDKMSPIIDINLPTKIYKKNAIIHRD